MATAGAYPTPGLGPTRYPVHVQADVQPAASRWLWLVKWLLALPHYIVLVFLWMAFTLLSLVALVAILFTGRYPRGIFEFNVGVLRWSWRVAYYSYGALATDQYPPFTLAEVAHYPAHLEVDYPERLSRWLVLVKWWLLALPHYVVVGIFLGTGTWAVGETDDWRWVWGGGLVGILVLVAAVVLAVTGRYPHTVYDLLLGLNRWVLRVAAYAGLMTDEYPPFRLDMGADEPGALLVPPSSDAGGPSTSAVPTRTGGPAPGGPPAPPPPRGQGWTAGRVVSIVAASLCGLLGLGLLGGGATMLVASWTLSDDGYLTSDVRRYSSDAPAAVVGDVLMQAPGPGDLTPARALGDIRVRAAADDNGAALFVGIARDADLDAYLSTAAPRPPETVDIWDAQAVGTGQLELVWTPRDGHWTLVVMNRDAAPAVAADVDVGGQVPWLTEAGVALVVIGLVLLAVGVVGVAVTVQRASRTTW